MSELEFARSRALVIGINDYTGGIPPLRTAANDAGRLAELLERDHDYEVRCLTSDVTAASIRDLLGRLRNEIGPDDRLLFYFAGHGIALDGDDGPAGYLIPQDAIREDTSGFLPMTELHDSLSALQCRHLLLILDCCFAGAFRWSSTRDLGALPDVIHRERYERYVQDPAWQVISSAAYDQKALDILSGETIGQRREQGEHSPFAKALFRAFEGEADLIPRPRDGQPAGDGVITATELYLYLRECVETATEERRTRQTPGLWALNKHDKGEFIFLTPGHPLNLPPAPPLNEDNNPYRGLSSYDERHSRFYFGRSKLIDKLHEVVREQPLTVLLGASGTGKSSLVKAGLLPRLRNSEENWVILEQIRSDSNDGETERVAVIRPGSTPLKSLASVEHPENVTEKHDLTRLADEFRNNPTALATMLRRWGKSDENARLLLVVDQFEELVTLCNDRHERDRFMSQLSNALIELPEQFRLVITLRSDFEPQFTETALGAWNTSAKRVEAISASDVTEREENETRSTVKDSWSAARFIVPPMSQDELRNVIEKPASVQVIYFEKGLVDDLINEVVQTPGALPLLSFTLSELYRKYVERRSDDRCLKLSDYEQLGGVAGSLRRRATEIYNELGQHQ